MKRKKKPTNEENKPLGKKSNEFWKGILKDWFLVTAVIVLAFIIYFFVYPVDNSFQKTVVQQPLSLNKTLQLFEGENYTYDYYLAEKTTVVYSVYGRQDNCTPVTGRRKDSDLSVFSGCVDDEGKVVRGVVVADKTIINVTGLDFFQQWMLALTENWSWVSEIRYENPAVGLKDIQRVEYKVVGEQTVLGRDAYLVFVNATTGDGDPVLGLNRLCFIDKEKRVILRSEFEWGTMRLIEAPFELRSDNTEDV